jgi:hypothetical protein
MNATALASCGVGFHRSFTQNRHFLSEGAFSLDNFTLSEVKTFPSKLRKR